MGESYYEHELSCEPGFLDAEMRTLGRGNDVPPAVRDLGDGLVQGDEEDLLVPQWTLRQALSALRRQHFNWRARFARDELTFILHHPALFLPASRSPEPAKKPKDDGWDEWMRKYYDG